MINSASTCGYPVKDSYPGLGCEAYDPRQLASRTALASAGASFWWAEGLVSLVA